MEFGFYKAWLILIPYVPSIYFFVANYPSNNKVYYFYINNRLFNLNFFYINIFGSFN